MPLCGRGNYHKVEASFFVYFILIAYTLSSGIKNILQSYGCVGLLGLVFQSNCLVLILCRQLGNLWLCASHYVFVEALGFWNIVSRQFSGMAYWCNICLTGMYCEVGVHAIFMALSMSWS